MKRARHFVFSVAIVLVGAAVTTAATPANAAKHSGRPFRATAAQLARLPRVTGHHLKGWMKAHVTGPLLYVSLLTQAYYGGQTNVYQIGSGSLALVGQLPSGGGPIAVDKSGNVYVGETGPNALGCSARDVDVYAPGATSPNRVLKNTYSDTWTVAVGNDGTVYVAGAPVSSNCTWSNVALLKYAPGATTGTLLPTDPYGTVVPNGNAVDAAGNVYVYWTSFLPTQDGGSPACQTIDDMIGCGRELAAGSSTWTTYLPYGGYANMAKAGPIFDSAGNQVLVVGGPGFQYLMSFAPNSTVPSNVKPLPITGKSATDPMAIAFSNASTLWGINTLFGSFLPSYEIWQIAYPSGYVEAQYPVDQSASPYGVAIPAENGIAVSE